MKTAISIPDELFEEAEAVRKKRGISRSEFYTNAIEHHLKLLNKSEITAKLNEIYASQSSELDPELREHQRRQLLKSEW